MSKDMRYNLDHMGDIVVDNMGKWIHSINRSFRGISLTYNIHDMKRKKQKQFTKIGETLTQVRKKRPDLDVFQDEDISDLYQAMDALEEDLEEALQEREHRLYPEKLQTATQEY